jgi:hypothetical protein
MQSYKSPHSPLPKTGFSQPAERGVTLPDPGASEAFVRGRPVHPYPPRTDGDHPIVNGKSLIVNVVQKITKKGLDKVKTGPYTML